jgi:hypothetical protein
LGGRVAAVTAAARSDSTAMDTAIGTAVPGPAIPASGAATRIVHLDDGVDFLGFNVRRYRGKLLIKPSRAAVKRIKARLTAEMSSVQRAIEPRPVGLPQGHDRRE